LNLNCREIALAVKTAEKANVRADQMGRVVFRGKVDFGKAETLKTEA
jgi:hypothetical protein